MLAVKIILSLLHLAALAFFALKYLRFDVKTAVDLKTLTIPDKLTPIFERIQSEIDKVEDEHPKFDRFVFFLLDAWRWNFLFSESTEMQFLKKQIMKGEAVGLVALARIPTVTKPCLKSIFAGTQPVFFEIVENIDESGATEAVKSSTGTTQDNLLQRLKRNGKKLAVYGDDVWAKLFPLDTFHRHDLAFGFNIMDYTEVDNLVHRGFENERTSSIVSDVIILHYLGLDHIGHSYAAKAEYVNPKLKEMDAKIAEVNEWVRAKDAEDGKKTLILMMGDHGMTSDGNHGGGSKDEQQAAAVFMSPHFNKGSEYGSWSEAIKQAELDSHNQEDIASTLTALLDGSSPLKFGNGCFIERVMAASDPRDLRKALLKNLKHLLELAVSRNSEKVALIDFEQWDNESLFEVSRKVKEILNSDGFVFNEGNLKLATGVLFLIAALYSILWIRGVTVNLESLVILVSVSIIAACQSATSFIDEEHLLWQTAFLAIFVTWSLRHLKSAAVYLKAGKVLAIHRVLCGWNSVGTIWAHEKTLGSFIKSNDLIECFGVIISLLWIIFRSKRHKIVLFVASVLVAIHRTAFFSSIPKHLLAQSVLCILVTEAFVNRFRDLESLVAILFILVNKPVNAVPVALILTLTEEINEIESLFTSRASTFLRLCLMQCAYYALGLWNSVSAIDLTFGAVFTKSFDMRSAPVVLLLYCWSGPLLVALVSRKSKFAKLNYELQWVRSILDCTACAFAYHHRFHPWVFDFFSPKILFQVFWAVFYCVLLPLIN